MLKTKSFWSGVAVIVIIAVAVLLHAQSGMVTSNGIRVDGAGRQQVVGADANGVTSTAAPLQIAGKNGTSVDAIKTDGIGNLAVNLSASTATINSIVSGDTPCHIATATTQVCKATTGTLKRIIVNTPVALATISFYDVASGSCSGTPANLTASITLPATLTNPPYFEYNMLHANGICVKTSGATDITLMYQ